jgi:hypothetical protein
VEAQSFNSESATDLKVIEEKFSTTKFFCDRERDRDMEKDSTFKT